MQLLRNTLYFIGFVQVVLGSIFTLAPSQFASMLDLEVPPEWVNWLFVMTGARFLGFGIGMFIAAREPNKHMAWIGAMIGIQALDWIGTIYYLVSGTVTLAQVTTAAFLPIIFIVILVRYFPNSNSFTAQQSTAH